MQALRLFCDVAALNSFSKAALKHGISQSAVSQRIRQFEESFGVQLLDRSVRPFRVTEAGATLLREGRRILLDYDGLLERVRSHRRAPSGEVRVAAIYSAGIGLLEGLRTRFHQLHSEVSVILEYHRPDEVAQEVSAGQHDFGIISYPNRWPNLSVRRLRDEEMCVVCSADHRLARRKWVAGSTLARFAMAGFDAELPVGRDIRRYLKLQGVTGPFAHVVDNIDTIKTLLRETDSIAILPRRTALREVEQGVLSVISLRPGLSRPMGLVTPKKAKLSGAAELFAEFLVKHGQAVNPIEIDQPAEPVTRAS